MAAGAGATAGAGARAGKMAGSAEAGTGGGGRGDVPRSGSVGAAASPTAGPAVGPVPHSWEHDADGQPCGRRPGHAWLKDKAQRGHARAAENTLATQCSGSRIRLTKSVQLFDPRRRQNSRINVPKLTQGGASGWWGYHPASSHRQCTGPAPRGRYQQCFE